MVSIAGYYTVITAMSIVAYFFDAYKNIGT
jgi:hypothetical protein